MTATSFRSEVRSLLRDRLLDAAQEIAVSKSWSDVTMAGIAKLGGVSRVDSAKIASIKVYNEFGSKPELAGELVMRELGRFLEVVRLQIFTQADVIDGIRGACTDALTMAETNPLLRAVISSIHQRENDLIPLLTTESQGVIDAAKITVSGALHEKHPNLGIAGDQLEHAVEAVVRLVLSHIMRPSYPPAEAADQIAWIARHVLNGN